MSALDRWLREGWLRPIDHALGVRLQRLRDDTPDAVALAAALASRAVAFGHSAVPLGDVPALLAEIATERAPPQLPEPDEWRAALRGSCFVGIGDGDMRDRPLVFSGDAIALRRYHDYECRLARALRVLTGPLEPAPDSAWLHDQLAKLFPPMHDGAIDRQMLASALAVFRRVLLITGGPGTGKTTTVARLLALRIEHARRAGTELRVALAAPTGKAAARLAEALRENYAELRARGAIDDDLLALLPSAASTLHRLLGGRPDSVRFGHDAKHPLRADLVIVDEASMIDLPLMCKLAEAVPPDAGLILLGDRDQLPSVETGDVLAALCDAAGDGIAVPVALAHEVSRAVGAEIPAAGDAEPPLARVELARSYRQSRELDLAPLSAAVRSGDVERALAGLRDHSYRGVAWLHGRDAALAAFVLDHSLPRYAALAAAPTVAEGLALARAHRVLTAVREGEAGSRTLNARIAEALQRTQTREGAFFHGRLVMIRENSYRHRLYNGDVGLAWRDDDGRLRVWFETGEGLRAWLPAALPAHEDAFALTVHKSQGSEFDDVLLALPERSVRVLSRELVYTGLTRARRALTLWANEDVLADAILRRAQRWSRLADRLRSPKRD